MNQYEYRVEISENSFAIVKMDLVLKHGTVITMPLSELDNIIEQLNDIKTKVHKHTCRYSDRCNNYDYNKCMIDNTMDEGLFDGCFSLNGRLV